jgi:hypothetical protein
MSKFAGSLITVGVMSFLAGCAPKAVEGPGSYSARSVVDIGPGSVPKVVGTYDFDLLGEAQGQACAEWGARYGAGFREVLVNGKPAFFSASVAGATFKSDDARIQQAENAAVFTALSGLNGADLMFVTRSTVTSETSERVCAHVWGQAVRLKKGPTLVPEQAHAQSAAPLPTPLNPPPPVASAAAPPLPSTPPQQ